MFFSTTLPETLKQLFLDYKSQYNYVQLKYPIKELYTDQL
jgi:hypothetical protein